MKNGEVIGHFGGYRRTLAFSYICLVYHATTHFCRRNFDFRSDPLGKTVGQMVGAARSALLFKMMQHGVEGLVSQPDFTERVARARTRARNEADVEPGSPRCPKCGGPMKRRVAKRGVNAGGEFWSCCAYPKCNGASPVA